MARVTPFDSMTLKDIMRLHEKGYNFLIHDGILVYIKISRNA